MKLLAVNAWDKNRVDFVKTAVNPSLITCIVPEMKGARIFFCGDTNLVTKETYEEIMALLGGDCEWKMP